MLNSINELNKSMEAVAEQLRLLNLGIRTYVNEEIESYDGNKYFFGFDRTRKNRMLRFVFKVHILEYYRCHDTNKVEKQIDITTIPYEEAPVDVKVAGAGLIQDLVQNIVDEANRLMELMEEARKAIPEVEKAFTKFQEFIASIKMS